jgi:Tol biopolymer transport system component
LIFSRGQALLVVPFDPDSLELTGPPAPLVENIAVSVSGDARFSVSRDGTLIYQTGMGRTVRNLQWVNRGGVLRMLTEEKCDSLVARLSPDGNRVAVSCYDDPTGRVDIWIVELSRDTMTRLTFNGRNNSPTWTADGKEVTFSSNREGPFNVYSKLADGSGEAKRLTNYPFDTIPRSWSPDGSTLLLVRTSSEGFHNIWMLSPDEDAQPLIATEFDETDPQFSPDGQWITYTSNETGRSEVYVTASDGQGRRWRISTDGGTEPIWARKGDELIYLSGDKMMAVSYESSPKFNPSKPYVLFEAPFLQRSSLSDTSVDGRELLMIQTDTEAASSTRMFVVLNWFEELERLFP